MTDPDPPAPQPKAPAPGALALVQRFLNSTEMPNGVDQLRTAQLAAGWLRRNGTNASPPSQAELQRLIDARETLRDLLEDHIGHNVDPDVAVRLQELLADVPVRPVFGMDGASLVAEADGVSGFLGRVSVAIVEATLAGTWCRLKVCHCDDCRWAFYDQSKNGRGIWCSMRVCGSREKARAYRARRKSGQPRESLPINPAAAATPAISAAMSTPMSSSSVEGVPISNPRSASTS